MIRDSPTTRRMALSGIASGVITAIGGCLSGTTRTNSVFDDVYVDGLDLVLEFAPSESLEQVNVIGPTDELFAGQAIATGVERETIELGTAYQPGEYTIVALEDGEEIGRQTLEIEPDVQITDLRLGQNHPDEMFEDASDIDVRTEAILTLENTGTGPEEIEYLSFSGAVPRPTPDDFTESGIYDTSSEILRHADSVEILPETEITVYSQSMPFSSSGSNVSCSAETKHGEFEVRIETAVQDELITSSYSVSYTGNGLDDCEIDLVEQQ